MEEKQIWNRRRALHLAGALVCAAALTLAVFLVLRSPFPGAGKAVLIVLAALIIPALTLSAVHRAALRLEEELLHAPGKLVDTDGCLVHVYAEGPESGPLLVFLSGLGTPSPLYNFKQLFCLLADRYRIAVVEKAGYGYSEIKPRSRDVASTVGEVRAALRAAGEKPPYILVPHSISGFDAIWWARHYPEELAGIAGLDISLPSFFEETKAADGFSFKALYALLRFFVSLGFHRLLSGVSVTPSGSLTEDEARQQNLLMLRNMMDIDILAEQKAVSENVRTLLSGSEFSLPVLLFTAKHAKTHKDWIRHHEQFAVGHGGKNLVLEGPHYIHNAQPERIAEEISNYSWKLD